MTAPRANLAPVADFKNFLAQHLDKEKCGLKKTTTPDGEPALQVNLVGEKRKLDILQAVLEKKGFSCERDPKTGELQIKNVTADALAKNLGAGGLPAINADIAAERQRRAQVAPPAPKPVVQQTAEEKLAVAGLKQVIQNLGFDCGMNKEGNSYYLNVPQSQNHVHTLAKALDKQGFACEYKNGRLEIKQITPGKVCNLGPQGMELGAELQAEKKKLWDQFKLPTPAAPPATPAAPESPRQESTQKNSPRPGR